MDASHLFRRILVGVDNEGLASDAVERAADLAGKLNARLSLVHAVEIPPPLWPGLSKEELADMHAAALVRARLGMLESLRRAPFAAGMEADLEEVLTVKPGHAAKVLLERAEEFQADLIVVGPHAKRPLFDFGSTTRALLSRTTCPLWNQVGPCAPVKRILVPVDFSDHSRAALEVAHALALRLEASIRVLHCYAPPEFAWSTTEEVPGPTYVIEDDRKATQEELERWMREFDWKSVPAESCFVEGLATTTLPTEAEQDDLVVMGTHGRTGLSRFLVGSVAYSALKQSEKPVLVIPSKSQRWLLGEA